MPRDFKKNRSDAYQWFLLETPWSQDMLVEYTESESFTGFGQVNTYNEALLDLQEQLRVAQWKLIDRTLTERQREVLHMTADGFTQTDIAKKLKVNQSSITKSINGNSDYGNGKEKKKVYGGAKKKLQKEIEEDTEIQRIIEAIHKLQADQK